MASNGMKAPSSLPEMHENLKWFHSTRRKNTRIQKLFDQQCDGRARFDIDRCAAIGCSGGDLSLPSVAIEPIRGTFPIEYP